MNWRVMGILAFGTALSNSPLDGASPGRVIAYDGFQTSDCPVSYRPHSHPGGHGPIGGVVGFQAESRWTGGGDHIRARDGQTTDLSHPLLLRHQPGSMGHWTFNGNQTYRRPVNASTSTATGFYTLCLLFRAHDQGEPDGAHTTSNPNNLAMLGFTPPGDTNGNLGLSLGYFETDLCVFVGRRSFPIVSDYEEDVTYLLVAELNVSTIGAEYVRGFYATEHDTELIPAKFNDLADGRGATIETWSKPEDLSELEFSLADPRRRPPQASEGDQDRLDFLTWDEVRLIDGPARLPFPIDPRERFAPNPQTCEMPHLLAYWPFDEQEGDIVKDAAGPLRGQLLQAVFTDQAKYGPSAVHFDDRPLASDGSDMVSISHEEATKRGLTFRPEGGFTFSAWIRGDGTGAFQGANDIITKCRSAQSSREPFRDLKGVQFLIDKQKLRLDLINSINSPQRKDNRLTVAGSLNVPDDGEYHHVAVTYDGSGHSAGVTFYLDGVPDATFSLDLELDGHQLTRPIDVVAPFNIGGRNDDHRDRYRYGFRGDIDEVAIFDYALTRGEMTALLHLPDSEFAFTIPQVESVFKLVREQRGEVRLGELIWCPVGPGALVGELGELQVEGRNYAIRLWPDGSGLVTK